MSLVDYQGRTIDVLAYQGAKPGGEVLLTQELVGTGHSGRVTTGIQKLAQRFLLILLTEKGSIIHYPDWGTDFLTEARTGTLQTTLDVFAVFSAALVDIKRQLIIEETKDDPDDERFDSAEILNVTLHGDRASISVQLTSKAGNSVMFVAPLETGA